MLLAKGLGGRFLGRCSSDVFAGFGVFRPSFLDVTGYLADLAEVGN